MYEVELSEAYFPAQHDTEYRDRTIEGMLREQVAERPDQLALRELLPDGTIGREWTYAQLLSDAERLGRALSTRHGKGARIAIYAGNCPEWVLLQMGAALAGLTVVTVNPAFIAREVRYVLEQSSSEAIYYQPHVRGTPLRPIIDEAVQGLDAIEHTIDIEDHSVLFAGADTGELRPTTPDSIVMIQYTSGTTGFPKGVLLHQHGLIQSNHDLFDRWDLLAGETLLCPFPLFHTAGSAACVLGSFSRGCTLLLASLFDPGAILTAIEREEPEMMGGVPTMIFAIVEAARAKGVEVKCFKRIMSGGAMVAPELNRAATMSMTLPRPLASQ